MEPQNGVKIVVPLKYLSNFWRSLEMPLISCKVELSLNWIENCVLTVANTVSFKITDVKRYVCTNCYFISRRQCEIITIMRQRV